MRDGRIFESGYCGRLCEQPMQHKIKDDPVARNVNSAMMLWAAQKLIKAKSLNTAKLSPINRKKLKTKLRINAETFLV